MCLKRISIGEKEKVSNVNFVAAHNPFFGLEVYKQEGKRDINLGLGVNRWVEKLARLN